MAVACLMVIRSMFPFIRLVFDGAGFVNSESILYINCQHKFLRLFSMTTNVKKKFIKQIPPLNYLKSFPMLVP